LLQAICIFCDIHFVFLRSDDSLRTWTPIWKRTALFWKSFSSKSYRTWR